ncbi:MAG TPA: FAD-linked oxidase C-terminal domain-containing protein [Armatimonadota bacterium]|nr:FAD-linked oxidase C-terminal domain-containing protein [Armatimonadota bacterium]
MSRFVPYRERCPVRSELNAELTRLLEPGRVLTSPAELAAYEYDASPESGRPDVVVLPESVDEVVAVVRLAARRGIPVVPRGAGTNLSGGSVAPAGGIVVHLSRMNEVYEIDAEGRRAVVGPGVVNHRVNALAAPFGLHFAPDPSSYRASTVGGNIAENSGGIHALKYGVTSHHVLGLEFVTPRGDVVRTGSKADGLWGYDLTGLLVGAEGTLGIVTKAILRLTPIPEGIETILALYREVGPAAEAASDVIAQGIMPAALEMMDRPSIDVVRESVGVDYPHDAGAVLLIEVDGEEATIAGQAEAVRAVCRRPGCLAVESTRDPVQRDRLWLGRRVAYAALARFGKAMIVCDGTVPRDTLGTIVPEMERVASELGLHYSNTFHAGDGNLHPKLLYDADDPRSRIAMLTASRRILEMCVEAGGTITGEHGVGSEKTAALRLVFGPTELELMRRIRRVFDPEARSNPGKVFDEPPMPRPKPPTRGLAEFVDQLRDIVGAEAVSGEYDIRAAHAMDGLVPSFVVWPSTPEQVAAVLGACWAEGAAVGVAGGGTRRSCWAPLSAYDVCLSTGRLDGVIEHRSANLSLSVGAGMTLAAAQDHVGAACQRLPLAASYPDFVSVGGLLARRASGPEELRFGPVQHRVLGLRVALGDGSLARLGGRCMKNVAGYDVAKAILGSCGTLGVICEATLALQPAPEAARWVQAEYASMGGAFQSARALARDAVELWALEVAYPRPAAYALVCGTEEDATRRARRCVELMEGSGAQSASILSQREAARLWPELRDFPGPPGRPVLPPSHAAGLEVRVPPAACPDLAARLPEVEARHRLEAGLLAGAGTGLVRVRLRCHGDAGSGSRLAAAVVALSELAASLGGTLHVEWAPLDVRQAWRDAVPAPDGLALMRWLKAALDPGGVLNPGRMAWIGERADTSDGSVRGHAVRAR